MTPWLAIVGINEDAALSERARALIAGAALVLGGARHLALAAPHLRGEARAWPRPMHDAYPAILTRRGEPVVVLASGDPDWFGVADSLRDVVPHAEMLILPAPSALALACARLGWAAEEVAVVSACGRPLSAVLPALQPGRRVLLLSADETAPAALAALLRARGFGASLLHICERLGGAEERVRSLRADTELPTDIARLNLVGIEVAGGPAIPRAAGLPDDWFEHDGQITKREVRAVTLAALAPCAGDLLWDVGAGSGSVAIEWLLADPAMRAVGIDRRADRAARAARNAERLGVPRLETRLGAAPDAFAGLPPPDAVFLGGGARDPAVIEGAWTALRPGGRLVANAVTIETQSALVDAQRRLGGTLTRIAIERLDAVGPALHGFRPAMAVVQWAARK